MTYVPGKTHNIADALSRAPIFPGSDDQDIPIDTALAYLVTTNNPALTIIHECIDEDYTQCMKDIQENSDTSHLIKQLKSVKGDICVLNGLLMIDARRIILPIKAIKPILSRLHAGHPGQEKTMALAQQLYYWQNMTNDIKTVVDNCNECQERRPRQPTNPRVTDPPSSAFGAPMAHVGLDLFDFAGKKHLICCLLYTSPSPRDS